MTEENIFNNEGTQTPSAETNSQPQKPIVPPELADWVGEGKKYASIDEVYKAFPHSQQHIETLNSKVRQLEEELNKRKSAEEVLNDIRSRETAQQKPTSEGVEVNKDVLSEVVARELASQKAREAAQANLETFKQEFTKSFGDKAEEAYAKLSQDTGLSYQELNAMATKSPKALLKLAGVNEKASKSTTSIESSINTQSLFNNPPTEEITARVSPYANSKELADGWNRAKLKVQRNLQG